MKNKMDEIHQLILKHNHDDFLRFENTKIRTETEMEQSSIGQRDRLSHEFKNKTIEMENLTKES